MFGVIAALTAFSEGGPARGWPTWVLVLLAISTAPVALVIATRSRMFVWWEPSERQRWSNIAFTLYADVGLSICLLLLTNTTLALACSALFAVLGPLVAFFTDRITLLMHSFFVTAVIAVIAGRAIAETPELWQMYTAGALAIWLACTATMTIIGAASESMRTSLGRQLDRARTDPLTGLLNIRGLQSMARRMLDPSGPPVGFLLIDLDHFKTVNDRHGHLVGDDALVLASRRLSTLVGEDALLTRRGGEEFLVVVQMSDGALRDLAERVRRGLQDPTDRVPVTVSVGVTEVCPVLTRTGSMDEMINIGMHNSDVAMYRAKAAGRNRVAEFRPS